MVLGGRKVPASSDTGCSADASISLPEGGSPHGSWFVLGQAVCFGGGFRGAWLAGGTGVQSARTREGAMRTHAARTAQRDAGSASSSQGAGVMPSRGG